MSIIEYVKETKKNEHKYNDQMAINLISRYQDIKKLRLEHNGLVKWMQREKKYEELTKNLKRNESFEKGLVIYKKEELQEIAFSYTSRSVFKFNNRSAYEQSRKMGIIDEICQHMKYGAEGSKNLKKVKNK